MKEMKIFEKLQNHYKKKLPFVAYKKPNKNIITAFLQQSNTLIFTKDFTESGFVFSPFDNREKSILIPENQSEFIKGKTDFKVKINEIDNLPINDDNRSFHCQIVDKAITNIANGNFRKVVLSRCEEVELFNFSFIDVFKKLVKSYPSAMTYVWYHPKVGLWLGATPETLVKINELEFETMSLAGTQVNNEATKAIWSAKELDEQQVVTDFIVDNLKPVCNHIAVSEVETVKAGHLLHLKTKITGKLKTRNAKLITRLHPTPAVCGFPKEVAKEFILKNENYDREFYTGFLGELNFLSPEYIEQDLEFKEQKTKFTTQNSELFVNLRCMQIKNNKALIYVGGGITKESKALKEWEETIAKSKTMRRVLC